MNHPMQDLFRMIGGILGILVVPGLLMTVIALPAHEQITAAVDDDAPRALDPIERGVLAVLFSIIVSSALVYILFAFHARLPIGGPITGRRLAIAFALMDAVLGVVAACRLHWVPLWFAFVVGSAPIIGVAVRIFWSTELTFIRGVAVFVILFLASVIMLALRHPRAKQNV